MKAYKTAKTITLRLRPDEYAAVVKLSKHKQLSMNRLFIDGMRLLEAQERQKRLFDDFTQLGDLVDEVGVEYSVTAQSEVVGKS